MFCGKCGKEIKEGTKFCPMCGGTVANVSQNKEKSTNKKRKAASIVGICAIALVVIVLFTTIGSGSGYKGIVKKYFRSMEKADGALYASIIADAYKQDMIDGWGYEEDELVEGYGEELQDEMSDYALQYGNNIKISYEIDDVYSATENDLIELRRELEYTHIISRKIVNWVGIESNTEMTDEPGAINEGYSDIFGEIIESYINGQEPNWSHRDRIISDPMSGNYPAAVGDKNMKKLMVMNGECGYLEIGFWGETMKIIHMVFQQLFLIARI